MQPFDPLGRAGPGGEGCRPLAQRYARHEPLPPGYAGQAPPAGGARAPLTATRSGWGSAAVPRRVIAAPGTTVPAAGSVTPTAGGSLSRVAVRVASAAVPARSTARATRVLVPSASGTR